jgi:hypothetical protein
MDGFDHYNPGSSGILQKWTAQSNVISVVGGRFGGQAVSTGSRSFTKGLGVTMTDTVVGFAAQFPAGVSGPFMRFRNGGTIQTNLHYDSSIPRIIAQRNGTSLAFGTRPVNPGVWYYIEFRSLFNDTTGIVQVKIDGIMDINASGLDTNNAAGNLANEIHFGDPGASNITVFIDDLYWLDSTGGAPLNTFLGDVKVESLYPNGDGASSGLAGSDGNSLLNYQLVDENPPNGDTDYVESQNVGDKDTYTYGDLAVTSGTVYAVQILPYARKTDAGSRQIVTVARDSGGTEVDSAAITLPTSYTYVAQDIRTTQPNGSPWDIGAVNGAQFGVKIAA